MEKQNNENGNVTKFRDAMNTHAEKVCGVPDAFSIEQAADMLETWTEQQGGNEDLAVARMCELAYGLPNVTLKDALLLLDERERKYVRAYGAALRDSDGKESTIADLVDVLVRHWSDFNDAEKKIVAAAVTGELHEKSGRCAHETTATA